MGRAGNRFLVLLLALFMAASTPGSVELGIDVLEGNGNALLRGKRIRLVTNQTGVDSRGIRTRALLKRNVNLVALYTPGHGLDGTEKAGRYVSSPRDPLTGLIAHSLYSPTRKPSPAMPSATFRGARWEEALSIFLLTRPGTSPRLMCMP